MSSTLMLLAMLAPYLTLAFAFTAGAILAAFMRYASEAPIASDDSAEWLESMLAWDAACDVDAEWIALADAPEAARPVLLASTRETLASVRADRAAVDAFIASRPTAAPLTVHAAARTYTAQAAWGVAASAARIVARMNHTAQATIVDASALPSGGKLTRGEAFAIDAKRAIAAHTARRTLRAYYADAFDREWRETFEAAPLPVKDCPENAEAAAYMARLTLESLARTSRDASELAILESVETTLRAAA